MYFIYIGFVACSYIVRIGLTSALLAFPCFNKAVLIPPVIPKRPSGHNLWPNPSPCTEIILGITREIKPATYDGVVVGDRTGRSFLPCHTKQMHIHSTSVPLHALNQVVSHILLRVELKRRRLRQLSELPSNPRRLLVLRRSRIFSDAEPPLLSHSSRMTQNSVLPNSMPNTAVLNCESAKTGLAHVPNPRTNPSFRSAHMPRDLAQRPPLSVRHELLDALQLRRKAVAVTGWFIRGPVELRDEVKLGHAATISIVNPRSSFSISAASSRNLQTSASWASSISLSRFQGLTSRRRFFGNSG